MHTHIHVILLACWHYGIEEIFHVLSELLFGDSLIQVEQLAEQFNRMLITFLDISRHETLRLHNNVFHQHVVVFFRHGGLQFLNFRKHLGIIVVGSMFTFQNVNIEISKLCV